jgi:hypothetical protein
VAAPAAALVIGVLAAIGARPQASVWAAPAGHVLAWRGLQPTSVTATPRLVIPGRTPAPLPLQPTLVLPESAPGGALPVRPGAPSMTRPAPATSTGRTPAAGSPRSGAGGAAGLPVGPSPEDPAAGLGPQTSLAAPAPAAEVGGDGAAALRPSAGAPAAAGAGAGPAGLLAGPVQDAGVRAMWQRYGSPRRGQSVAERLTAGRPALWGWWPFYVLLGLFFALLVIRIWDVMGELALGQDGRMAAGENVAGPARGGTPDDHRRD